MTPNPDMKSFEALEAAESMLTTLAYTRWVDNDTWDAIDQTLDKIRAALAEFDQRGGA